MTKKPAEPSVVKPEHVRAAEWRAAMHLGRAELAELLGYSREAIGWFERGVTPPGRSKDRTVDPHVWRRYKMAAAGLTAQLKSGKTFDW